MKILNVKMILLSSKGSMIFVHYAEAILDFVSV